MPLTDNTLVRTVTVDGVEVTFHDSQTGPEGSRPLVLVHGTGGNTATHFGHLYPMMATRTRVIGVDFAPTGKELTVDALAAQVLAAADEALGKDTPFDLLGYSLGSAVATHLASQLGERVQHLVLAAGWQRTDLKMRLEFETWTRIYESDPEAIAPYNAYLAFSQNHLRLYDEAMTAALLERCRSTDFTAEQFKLDTVMDLGDEAERITAKTLIVSFTQDMMVPALHQYELLGAIDDARLTTITSGHGFFVERPAELMLVVDLFLRDPDRYPAGTVIPETHA